MQPLILESALEAVATMDLGQVLGELNGVTAAPVRAGKRACAKRSQAADVNCGQAPVFGSLRNTLDAIFSRDTTEESARGL